MKNRSETRRAGKAPTFRLVIATVATTGAMLALWVPRAAAQATVIVTSEVVPFSQSVFVSCAGEYVLLTGFQRVIFRSVTDSRGGLHTTVGFHPIGVVGVGETTGDPYRPTGGTQRVFNAVVDGASAFTLINTFLIIGQGRGADFVFHQVAHTTVDGDGTLVVTFNKTWADCR